MTCDVVREGLSLVADGEASDVDPDAVDTHLLTCPECRRFRQDLTDIRQLLRFEAVEHTPDVAPAVLARILRSRARRRRPPWTAVAAAAAVGAVAGAIFVGIGRTPDAPAAAEIPERVLAAQHEMSSLEASVTLIERGARPDQPERRFVGTLAYRAPESLALSLTADDGAHIVLMVDEGTWWAEGERRCTPPALATCASIPTTRVVVNREPFADASPVALDVVAPVASFGRSASPTGLGYRRIDGRRAVGVRVTAGQVAPVLASIDPTRALRELHPADPTDVWLDADHLVVLAVDVRAGAGADRVRWAAARGYQDEPNATILQLDLGDVRVNEPLDEPLADPPPGDVPPFNGGFDDTNALDVPLPGDLPRGMDAYRSGVVRAAAEPGSEIGVRSWTDGRAWLTVRVTRHWPGGRLFGDIGDLVRPVDLGVAGVGYLGEDGTRIGLHADSIDVVVSGSVPTDELRRVAASLGIRGLPVPSDWAEATSSSVADADLDRGLLVPAELEGFESPAVRVDGEIVTIAAAGAGERAFVLVATPGTTLPPPLDPDVVGVEVRSTIGRFSPSRSDLEWVEEGRVYSLRGAGLGLEELMSIAADLEPR